MGRIPWGDLYIRKHLSFHFHHKMLPFPIGHCRRHQWEDSLLVLVRVVLVRVVLVSVLVVLVRVVLVWLGTCRM